MSQNGNLFGLAFRGLVMLKRFTTTTRIQTRMPGLGYGLSAANGEYKAQSESPSHTATLNSQEVSRLRNLGRQSSRPIQPKLDQ